MTVINQPEVAHDSLLQPRAEIVGVGYRTDDELEIAEARRLTAEFYLRRGFIQRQDIDELSGAIKPESDPYVDSSEYYVINGLDANGEPRITATVRKILPDEELGWRSFPVMEYFEDFEDVYQKEILATGTERCVEISALARNPEASSELDALNLYKTIWQEALGRQDTVEQEDLWLMAASPALFDTFSQYFNGAIKQVGPELPYPGQVAIPAIVRPVEGFVDLVMNVDAEPEFEETRRFVVNFMLDGIDFSTLNQEITAALVDKGFIAHVPNELSMVSNDQDEPSAEDIREVGEDSTKSLWETRKPEIIAGAGLLGYTALRTLAVKNGFDQPGDHVDWRVFLGIEVATTPPYVWAAGETIRSLKDTAKMSMSRRLAAFSVFTSTFLAPYAYVGAVGGEASVTRPSVVVPMGAFAAISGIGTLKKVRQARREI
jgi:hypothetical protein